MASIMTKLIAILKLECANILEFLPVLEKQLHEDDKFTKRDVIPNGHLPFQS